MIDWTPTPAVQKRLDKLKLTLARLQQHFDLRALTIDERRELYLEHKKEEEKLRQMMGQRRPPPKWKV